MIKRLLLLFTLIPLVSFGAKLRKVEMSWPSVQGAQSYEYKLIKFIKGNEEVLSIDKLDTPTWAKELKPGKYQFQIRSLDYRGVPGPWSAKQPFDVSLPTVNQTEPYLNQSFNLNKENDVSITFRWNNVPEAEKYHLVIKNDQNKIIHNDIYYENRINIDFQNMGKFQWKVTALTKKDKKPKLKTLKFEKHFKINAPPIDPPEARFSVTGEHVIIEWNSDKNSVKENIQVFRKRRGKWKRLYKKTQKRINSVRLKKSAIPKGKYKLKLTSFAKDNSASEPATVYFNWDKDSISGVEKDTNSKEAPSADQFGKSNWEVTLGLGLEAWNLTSTVDKSTTVTGEEVEIKDELSGFSLHMDLERFLSESSSIDLNMGLYSLVTADKTWALPIIESHYVYSFLSAESNLNAFMGGFIKKLPLETGDGSLDSDNKNVLTLDEFTFAGLSVGTKFSFYLSEFIEFGGMVKGHYNATATQAPSELEFEPSISYFGQGFGSYTLTKNIKFGLKLNYENQQFQTKTETYLIEALSSEFFLNVDI